MPTRKGFRMPHHEPRNRRAEQGFNCLAPHATREVAQFRVAVSRREGKGASTTPVVDIYVTASCLGWSHVVHDTLHARWDRDHAAIAAKVSTMIAGLFTRPEMIEDVGRRALNVTEWEGTSMRELTGGAKR